VRLDAIMKIENLGRISECIVDFFLRPDIERAFSCLLARRSVSADI
jgi:hypothetical protein